MITEWYKSGSKYASQNIRAKTILFDKTYFWLTDVDGTWYLLREGDDGLPSFV